MADRTDAVLAMIDGALEDYTTSADAMRWSPDRTAATLRVRLVYDFAQLETTMRRMVMHERAPGDGYGHADHRLDADHVAWWDRGWAIAGSRPAPGPA